jgi:hypothetical protein
MHAREAHEYGGETSKEDGGKGLWKAGEEMLVRKPHAEREKKKNERV